MPSLLLFPAAAPLAPRLYAGRLEAEAVLAWVAEVRTEAAAGHRAGAAAARAPRPGDSAVEQRMAGLTSELAKAQRAAAMRVEL